MNEVIKNCILQCQAKNSRLALPEAEDPRIQAAAVQIKAQKIASPVLLGNQTKIIAVAKAENNDLSDIEIVDTEDPTPCLLYTSPSPRDS